MAYHGSCHVILYGYGMRKVLTIDWVHATISTLLRRHANIMTLELVVKLKLIVSDTSFHWVKQMLLFLQPHFTAYFIVAGAGTSQALIRLRLQPAAVIFTWKPLQYSSKSEQCHGGYKKRKRDFWCNLLQSCIAQESPSTFNIGSILIWKFLCKLEFISLNFEINIKTFEQDFIVNFFLSINSFYFPARVGCWCGVNIITLYQGKCWVAGYGSNMGAEFCLKITRNIGVRISEFCMYDS